MDSTPARIHSAVFSRHPRSIQVSRDSSETAGYCLGSSPRSSHPRRHHRARFKGNPVTPTTGFLLAYCIFIWNESEKKNVRMLRMERHPCRQTTELGDARLGIEEQGREARRVEPKDRSAGQGVHLIGMRYRNNYRASEPSDNEKKKRRKTWKLKKTKERLEASATSWLSSNRRGSPPNTDSPIPFSSQDSSRSSLRSLR